jgi:hypothetical protein
MKGDAMNAGRLFPLHDATFRASLSSVHIRPPRLPNLHALQLEIVPSIHPTTHYFLSMLLAIPIAATVSSSQITLAMASMHNPPCDRYMDFDTPHSDKLQ